MPKNKPMTLQPGLLVSLRTRHTGGVKYDRVDLQANKELIDETTASVAKWETTKIVEDVDEHERAVKLRGKCGSLVRSVCTYSEFGLLCRADKEAALDAAIDEARTLAEGFNRTAKKARIFVYVLKGRIAETDAEAARAVGSELRDLIGEMQAGVTAMSVERIREAASKAKKLAAMVDEGTGKTVNAAVTEARGIATELLKRLTKSADEAATYIKTVTLRDLSAAGAAFIDLDEPTVGSSTRAPSVAPVGELDTGDEVTDAAAASV